MRRPSSVEPPPDLSEVPVAILVGGRGTRLEGLTAERPKALVDIHGSPFLHYQLDWLRAQGLREVVLCVGYHGEMIARAAGDGSRFGLKVRPSYDGPRPLGTAGAIRKALPELGGLFFVLNGDAYFECDMGRILQSFLSSGASALMTVFRNENRWGASNVEFSSGRVLAYDKERANPRMRHIDYGLSLFHRKAFAALPPGRPCNLDRVYQEALSRGSLASSNVTRRPHDIGTPSNLRETRLYLKSKALVEAPKP